MEKSMQECEKNIKWDKGGCKMRLFKEDFSRELNGNTDGFFIGYGKRTDRSAVG